MAKESTGKASNSEDVPWTIITLSSWKALITLDFPDALPPKINDDLTTSISLDDMVFSLVYSIIPSPTSIEKVTSSLNDRIFLKVKSISTISPTYI